MANPRLIRLSYIEIPTIRESGQLRETMEALYSDLDAAEDNLRLSKEKDILTRTLSDYMAILSPFKDSLTTYLHELENTIRIDGVWERYIQERRNC
jgi:hypothetical protein